MSRNHALLVGVADQNPQEPFAPGPSLDLMTTLLEDLGRVGPAWTVTRLEGPQATREGILAALAALESRLEPHDAVLFYFVGHGGIVEIRDLDPPFGGRPVFYVTGFRPGTDWYFTGVLDLELSLILSRMDRRCGNVTAILDCCYAATVVRGPSWPLPESPEWLRELASRWQGLAGDDVEPLLHPRGHPGVVRLAGASSLGKSYAARSAEGHLGHLTRVFAEVLNAAGLDLAQLSWEAVAHRVREQLIWDRYFEEQWVTLAGPRRRLLFSILEVPPRHQVAFVPRERGGGGWLRAGAMQGLEVGDRWQLLDPRRNDGGLPRSPVLLEVTAVDLSRAAVEAIDDHDTGDAPLAPPGTCAVLLGASHRQPVLVDGPRTLRQAVSDSSWLEPFSGDPDEAGQGLLAVLSLRGDRLEVRSAGENFAPARFASDAGGVRAAIDLMQDWARVRRLLRVAEDRAAHGGPITMTLHPGRGRALEAGTQLHVGDRLQISISCSKEQRSQFVNVVLVDVAGRPTLVDGAEPEGREILGGERVLFGQHPGARPQRGQQGLELAWPPGVDTDRPRPLLVIALSSNRPIPLGHLVDLDPTRALFHDKPRPRRAASRRIGTEPRARTGPELCRDWSALVWRGELAP
ncbi:MAG: caspase family protein [Myxococcales bacterium]|nr:caspase family protein [Myxococcales bacterium]